MSTPFFYPQAAALPRRAVRRELAREARLPTPGPTCQAAECAGSEVNGSQSTTIEGGDSQMAKKAKAAKKKAAKKK